MQLLIEDFEASYPVYKIDDETLLGSGDQTLDTLLEQARSLSKNVDSPQTIIVMQKVGVNGFSNGLLRNLNSQLLRESLRTRLVKIRLLLRLIRKSPSTWIYLSQDQCLGLYAEMALACDYHFCLSDYLRFGFPEMLAEVFPFGGVVESINRSNSRFIENWKSHPIKVIHRGDPNISCIFLNGENAEQSLMLVIPRLEAKPFVSAQEDVLIEWYESYLREPELNYGIPMKSKNHWEDSLHLLKKGESKIEKAKWFIDATSGFMFTQTFQNSLSKSYTVGSLKKGYIQVYIEVSQAIIESYPFIEMLSAGVQLVVSSVDQAKVQRSLEILYLSLERRSNRKSLKLWEDQVFWSVGLLPKKCNFIRYNIDRTIDFSLRGDQWKCWLLKSSNDRPHILAAPGTNTIDMNFMLSSGFRVIQTPGDTNLALFLRSWLLEEYMDVALMAGGIHRLLEGLVTSGWGFAGVESEWEFFLRHRHFDDVQTTQVGAKTLQKDVWELVSWSRFLERLSHRQIDGPRPEIRKLSEHFHVFCVMAFCVLSKELSDMDSRELAVLVSTTLGLPRHFSLPTKEGNQISTRRWGFYIKQYWPDHYPAFKDIYS